MNDTIDEGIFWLVMVPAGIALAAMWAMLLSPLHVPYLAVRWVAGPERADRYAWAALALIAIGICVYQVALWVADPLTLFLGRPV
jgi:hypothetical protein